MEKRTLIVGDIHGCLHEFERLLEKLHFVKKRDRLILVGDLINKGPFSLGVLKKARSLQCEVVLGNHENNFIRFMEGSSHPSRHFEKLKNEMGDEGEFWREWFGNLPLFIEDKNFFVVHAGIRPDAHPRETNVEILTRIRTWDGRGENLHCSTDPPWFDLYRGEKLVVFGHWASLGLMVRRNAICLDSGCVYGKKLSALVLPERRIVQVNAKRAYEEIPTKEEREA